MVKLISVRHSSVEMQRRENIQCSGLREARVAAMMTSAKFTVQLAVVGTNDD